VNIVPIMDVSDAQYLNVALGINGLWYGFSQQLNNGYYDPHSYQLYQGVSYFTIKQSEDVNHIITIAIGTEKDETMIRPGFAADFTLRSIIGIYDDWQINALVEQLFEIQRAFYNCKAGNIVSILCKQH